MQLFFSHSIQDGQAQFDPIESGHLVQSLRKRPGDVIHFTDGKGNLYQGKLLSSDKRSSVATIESVVFTPLPAFEMHLIIAPTKQHDRMEWLVEKAVELGTRQITFCATHRSERNKIRLDRLERIALSAMKQSLQYHLPVLNYQDKLDQLFASTLPENAFIAACLDEPPAHMAVSIEPGKSTAVLIGPEGDFTKEEIALAEDHGFQKISLGQNRLRTETAALYAATIFKTINQL